MAFENHLRSDAFEEQLNNLTPMVVQELLDAFRNNPPEWIQKIMAFFLRLPAKKFTRLLLEFDTAAKYVGPSAACEYIYPYFFDKMEVKGAEKVPSSGPLILASNHPGGMDFISIAGHAKRDDLRIITSDVNFLRPLPVGSQYLIMMPNEPRAQFRALKSAVEHLENGGMLLLFPTGMIDPDPYYFQNAKEHLNRWSKSLELFVRKVPEVQIQPIIVSQAIDERILFRRPLVKLQERRADRQRIAEFSQVMKMVFLKGRRFNLKASFGDVLRYQGSDKAGLTAFYDHIKSSAEQLMDTHLEQYPPVRQELWPEKPARFRNQ